MLGRYRFFVRYIEIKPLAQLLHYALNIALKIDPTFIFPTNRVVRKDAMDFRLLGGAIQCNSLTGV